MKTKTLKDTDVEWVVNDIGELGVKIKDQFFFLYKGESIVYDNLPEDDDQPLKWRHVWKREFGECCHSKEYQDLGNKCWEEYKRTGVRQDFLEIWRKTSVEDASDWKEIPKESIRKKK